MIEREWVSVRDPEDAHLRYTFDVSFLLSSYTCIYGSGCLGVHPAEQDPAIGCCVHGAYLNDDDDADELATLVRTQLDPTSMQFHDDAVDGGMFTTDDEGEVHTRIMRGGCIFANRSDFEGPPGCVFHHLAIDRGEHHMTYKPTVCWQVPLHRTIEEQVGNDGKPLEVHTIAAYERGHWGEGGSDFDWWCLDDDTAFVSNTAVYRTMETELRAMVGDAVYDELAHYLDRRSPASSVTFLPLA
ncbi:MAG: hypothetical protein WD377_05580 [Nitriliruptoraceae bacterium]